MAEDWAADVKKYIADADDEVIKAIVRYCGIALRNRDSSLVSFTDSTETDRVRNNFLKKKLGLTHSDEELDSAIAAVGARMKGDNFKNRVTVYYLLLEHLGLHDLMRKVPKGAAGAAAGAAAAGAAALGLASLGDGDAKADANADGDDAGGASGKGGVVAAAVGAAGAATAAVTGAAGAAASGAADVAGKAVDSAKAAAAATGDAVTGAVGAAGDAAGKAGAAVAGAAAAGLAGAAGLAAAAGSAAGDAVSGTVGAVGDVAGKAADAVGDAGAAVAGAVGDAGAAVAGAAAAGLAGVTGAASGLVGKVGDAFDGDGDSEGGIPAWLLWLLGALLVGFLLWWVFFRNPAGEVAADANGGAAMATASAPAVAASGSVDLAAAPAEGTMAIPDGAGVTAETRDGKPVVKVYFDTAKTDVVPVFADTAAGLKGWMDGHAGSKLAVSGFNDPRGNAATNAALSKGRAEAVKAALVKAGIADTSIDLVKPAEGATDAKVDLAGARRVEVTVQ